MRRVRRRAERLLEAAADVEAAVVLEVLVLVEASSAPPEAGRTAAESSSP
jgi:hypothetical protein